MSLVARLANLLRGAAFGWIGRRERRHPAAVYEAAIEERAARYAKLREAAAGVLYMRSKLAAELARTSAELSRTTRELEIAVERDDDALALALIARRDRATQESDRLAGELRELDAEAETAKKNLIGFQDEIARLREEKVRMLARLANAKARLRLQETLAGLSPDADVRALEAVREHVHRAVEEARLSRELGDAGLEKRLGEIRAAEAESAARAELAERKRTRRARLLPVALREPAPFAG